MVRVVVVGDTHNRHHMLDVPDGDVFIHCGDLTKRGTVHEMREVNAWLEKLPHRHKVVICGNMDQRMERMPSFEDRARLLSAATYLEDSSLEVAGLKLYGSPYTPKFHGAFQLEAGYESDVKWASIPEGLDILITHGPPRNCLDCTGRKLRVGCASLLQRVKATRPRYHIFGHVHEQGGKQVEEDGIKFINAAQNVMTFDIEPSMIFENTAPKLPNEQLIEDRAKSLSSAQHEVLVDIKLSLLTESSGSEPTKDGIQRRRRWCRQSRADNHEDEH